MKSNKKLNAIVLYRKYEKIVNNKVINEILFIALAIILSSVLSYFTSVSLTFKAIYNAYPPETIIINRADIILS